MRIQRWSLKQTDDVAAPLSDADDDTSSADTLEKTIRTGLSQALDIADDAASSSATLYSHRFVASVATAMTHSNAATGGDLNPTLSANAANPLNVVFIVSGLPSDYSGTVTFTDTNDKSDVVPIDSDGIYSANLANLAQGTLTYVMTVTDPTGNVLTVDPTVTLGDGSANASAGSPELPSLLSGYAVRPSWMVAGVDYYVGLPTGTVLNDPTLISMAGVSVDTTNHLIRITGNNVTLSGYDFSLHGGYGVLVTGANDTITNSNFGLGTYQGAYEIYEPTSGGGGLTITNCTFNETGTGQGNSESGIIAYGAPGTITLQYNLFENFPQHVLEMTQSAGTTASLVYEYNLIENGGIQPGAHLNYLQFANGTINNPIIEYNTTYQTPQAASGEGFQLDGFAGNLINNPTIAYNTIIATGGGAGSSNTYLLHGGYDYSQTGNPTTQAPGTSIHDNYFNISAAYGAFYPGSFVGGIGGVAASVFNNVNMTTGKFIQADNLQVAPTTVTNALISPSSGVEAPGDTIILTLEFSTPVNASGTPILSLNDGDTATYIGGSGTNALTFNYTVQTTDSPVSSLSATGINLNGGTITDGAGDAVNLSLTDLTQIGPKIGTLPNPPPPHATSADLIMRNGTTGHYEIYDIGENTVLAAYPLAQINSPWQVAGLGTFNGTDTSDILIRNASTGAFEVYDINNNNITDTAPMGQVGLEWSVSGLGAFGGKSDETDMIMRDSDTGQFEVYDIAGNQITSAASLGQVGTEWQVAGFGDFSTRADETDMLMRNIDTGRFELYDISNNQFTFATPMGQVGLEWAVVGFGDFSGNANESDMLMRNTSTGQFEIYDIQNNTIVSTAPFGQVGTEWQVTGVGPMNVGSSRVDLQACKLEYSIVSPK